MTVISGAQTGVDRAALRAARDLGFPTGGFMPRGFKAHDGCHPEFVAEYGIEEDVSDAHWSSTYSCVFNSSATVRVASNFDSAGEVCTLKAIRSYRKRHLDILWAPADDTFTLISTGFVDLHSWLAEAVGHGGVCNFGGNSERSAPGITESAYWYIAEELVLLLEEWNQ